MIRVLATIALAASLAFAAACGGDDDDGGATPTAPPPTSAPASPTADPTEEPTAAPTEIPDSTDIDAVDDIIAAALAGDEQALRDLLLFTATACVVDPMGAGAPPECRDGETAGALVDVIATAQCEGFYAREDEVRFGSLLDESLSLHGVFGNAPNGFPPGDYVIVFSHTQPNVGELAISVVASDAGIVGINFGCGESPAQAADRLGAPIVVPGG